MSFFFSPVSRMTTNRFAAQGLLFRGLGTRVLANGLQSVIFTVLWRAIDETFEARQAARRAEEEAKAAQPGAHGKHERRERRKRRDAPGVGRDLPDVDGQVPATSGRVPGFVSETSEDVGVETEERAGGPQRYVEEAVEVGVP